MPAELVDVEPGSAEWLEVRRSGVTATDIPVILGLSPWDSPFALWHRKAGNLPERPDSDLFRWARYGQEYCRERWEEACGAGMVPQETGLWRDGWRMATPDYLAGDNAVLECKTVGSWDGWGRGDSDVPAYVRVQVEWQLAVLERDIGYVAAVNRQTGQFRDYAIQPADQVEAMNQFMAGLLFWESLEDARPPDVDDAVATTEALKALNPRHESNSAEIGHRLHAEHEVTVNALKQWKKERQRVENAIRLAMGEARYATVGGERVLSRIVTKVEGHWVGPSERDYLLAARKREDKDE